MSFINHSVQMINFKIIYWGPKESGKTENIKWLAQEYKKKQSVQILKLSTPATENKYFDLLSVNEKKMRDLSTRFYYYTMPSGSENAVYRKILLKGLDGMIFVANSQKDQIQANESSLLELQNHLEEQGYNLNELPLVFQYNKRDLTSPASINELNEKLNKNKAPYFEAQANKGEGVLNTLQSLNDKLNSSLTEN